MSIEIDDKEIVSEIMGTFTRTQPPPAARAFGGPEPFVNDPRRREEDIRISGPTVRNCNTLEAWQKQIVNQLNLGRDQYVIARPGGGKTLPIICYWTDSLLGLNSISLNTISLMTGPNLGARNGIFNQLFAYGNINRRDVPKLLILVPVITLAQQTAMEIRRDLANIMMQMYNNNPNYYIDLYLRHYMPDSFQINRLATEAYQLRQEIGYLDTPVNPRLPERDYSNLPRIQEALRATNKSLVSEVERCIAHMIDRMVYLRTGGHNPTTRLEDALVYVSIYESAPSFVDRIQSLRLVVIDEAHLIQQSGNIYDDESRSFQISGSLFKVLRSIRGTRDCRLVMLSGTINPTSAGRITRYFNRCFDRNFTEPASAPPDAANRSTLSITVNDNLDHNGIVNGIVRSVNQREWGQLYVLFSTNRINAIVEDCIKKISIRNIESSSPGGYEFSNVFSGLGKERQNSQNIELRNVDKLGIPPGTHLQVANITNPLLRQAVLRGIGFIYRNIPGNYLEDREKMEMNDTDKTIVAKLFKERKLNVLLATDAVGIGVNIDVKDLYIPGVEKYSSKVKSSVPIALRDLAQIINRAGRGATPIASIQTTTNSVEAVANAIYMNPEDLPDVDVYADLGYNNLCTPVYFARTWISNFIRRTRN